ncbi:SEC-C metal-binding domain-containing protein [Actinomadura monticuli]|uniref:SEC-C metal-binding domain-containing protein n=1 Tax=Actinomadura monticuli TaxID=3097367 RepID=UPI00356AA14F
MVGGDTELVEKLGGNDPCPCGSGRRFPALLPIQWTLRRRPRALLRARLTRPASTSKDAVSAGVEPGRVRSASGSGWGGPGPRAAPLVPSPTL